MSAVTPSEPSLQPENSAAPGKATRVRWMICALLFFATTINYIDRSILNAMAPTLAGIIKWKPYQYGLIGAGFTIAYGIGFLLMGALIDRVGTRKGFAISLVIWTLSAISTAFTSTPLQFGLARFALGLGEAGNYPAAIKTVAEWFPQKERATATGFVNAGSNMGALLAPVVAWGMVPFLGWRSAFLVTPCFAAVWLVFWLVKYRAPAEHPSVNEAERQLIGVESGKPKKVRWRNILPHRQAWSFMVTKSMTDPVWWFFLLWTGVFLNDKFGVNLTKVTLPLMIIYVIADVGSIAGGWLSSKLIRKGWSPNLARKTTMCICAVFILPVAIVPGIPSDYPGGIWIAALLIGCAAGGHQGFSSNLFTTTSDMFPRRAVSTVNAVGGVSQAIAITMVQAITGVIVEIYNDYSLIFLFAGLAYPAGILALHLLAPRLEPVTEETLESKPMPRGVTAFVFAVLVALAAVPLSYFVQVGMHNDTDAYVLDRKSMIEQTFKAKAAALPKDLVKSADIKVDPNEKVAIQVKLTLDREPTAAEAPAVAELKAYGDDSLKKSMAATKRGFTFVEYIASALPPGTIYHSVDASRVMPPLVWTPLGGLAVGALLGAGLHGLIFRRRKVESA